MKLSRSLIREGVILLGMLGFFLWLFFFSGRFFHSHTSNASNRSALVQLHQAIQLDSSASEVRELFERYSTPQLKLYDERVTDWQIRMPMELGAADWKLLLDFRDGKVVRVRLLTADGPPPKDGPPDKTKADAYQDAAAMGGIARLFQPCFPWPPSLSFIR